MTDLGAVLPSFPVQKYTNLLPSLEKHSVSTADLLTLDSLEIAKIAQLPVLDIKRLCQAVRDALHSNLGIAEDSSSNCLELLKKTGKQVADNWSTISLLDDDLSYGLSGGIPTGSITEITGESGAGKTQYLLTLSLAVQLPPPQGLSSSTLYITTESTLPVNRVRQLLVSHPALRSAHPKPSLDHVVSIHTPDIESQDHIIYFQVPVALKRYNARLLIIDSIASNYRAEFDLDQKSGANMGKRSAELIKLGNFLRSLAAQNDIAIVVANQVGDRIFESNFDEDKLASRAELQKIPSEFPSRSSRLSSPSVITPSLPDYPQSSWKTSNSCNILSLDYQQRWFTGWGDEPSPSQWALMNTKTPCLGLVWTTQIACRIALIKRPVYRHADGFDNSTSLIKWKRWQKVIFASHAPSSSVRVQSAVEFQITGEGLKSVKKKPPDDDDKDDDLTRVLT
ncbi:DNA repair protein rhp57 [Golovinomyces cichoracearum]|uniref:DNA repair protein rhp57 n=1 Tax=Golovinomyces cichoracearum TaxID=62708 RepID=A0A420INR3_9PEZI|nr:DNA repair protein rhp57 [Golovinomyces cichoracearum]